MPKAWNSAGPGARFVFLVAILVAHAGPRAQEPGPIWDQALEAMPGARAERPESRVGQVFWVQSKARPFSVDFFASPELETRVPMEGTRRFVVKGLTRAGAREGGAPLYQVGFDSEGDAFILVESFEVQLYVDLPPQSETRLKSDLYLSPQAYFFSIKSIFSEDPEQLWERVRSLGPSRVRPLVPAPTPVPQEKRP